MSLDERLTEEYGHACCHVQAVSIPVIGHANDEVEINVHMSNQEMFPAVINLARYSFRYPSDRSMENCMTAWPLSLVGR